MYRRMLKRFSSAVLGGICCCIMVSGCASTDDQPAQSTKSEALPVNGFISEDEFCRAKMIHVATQTNKAVTLEGRCYIEDNSTIPVVGVILKRAIKAYNLQIAQNRKDAKYILSVVFSQRHVGRRTQTTAKIVFSENKKDNPILWSGAAGVSARGSHSADLYAASLTGAIMYNFYQFTTTNVNRRMLQSYYQRLASIGD